MHPEIPEGINVSKSHPLADFGLMLVGAFGIVVVLFLCAQVLAGFLVKFISFETETRLFEQSPFSEIFEISTEHAEQTNYLQSLTDQLAGNMNLPQGMAIKAHFSAEEIPNAYATLGGNIVIYQGLIDNVSSENGLAMVIAHEIAHIKNRDPIMALGRGTVSLLGIMALTGFSGSGAMADIAGLTGAGMLSKFSRDQERAADEEAVEAVLKHYGTLDGADEFFAAMLDESMLKQTDFFSTHPPTEDRINRIKNLSDSNGPHTEKALTELPDFFDSFSE